METKFKKSKMTTFVNKDVRVVVDFENFLIKVYESGKIKNEIDFLMESFSLDEYFELLERLRIKFNNVAV
ncbi:hypothetical protein [Petrimonas sp.]|jgi:hypothetical protein|uniref:hypothetical protein n=1 Tax=Petrimonas sp. TaxID=2023866 RepID=UPI002FC851D0